MEEEMKETCLFDFKNELTEFIELEKSLMPRREAIEDTLEKTRGKSSKRPEQTYVCLIAGLKT